MEVCALSALSALWVEVCALSALCAIRGSVSGVFVRVSGFREPGSADSRTDPTISSPVWAAKQAAGKNAGFEKEAALSG